MSWFSRFQRLTIDEASLKIGALLTRASIDLASAIEALTSGQPTESHATRRTPSQIDLVVQSFCLYAHLTDRLAFAILGPEHRSKLMNLMVPPFITMIAERFPADARAKIEAAIFAELDAFQQHFGAFRLEPEPNQGLNGTVAWEFGKRIAALYGEAMDALVAVPVAADATRRFASAQIPQILLRVQG